MWSIKAGDNDYGVFSESDFFNHLEKAKEKGCDVFQIADNFVVSHANGNVYVCSMIK